jgi:DTW domain-containing protein YfiP
MKRKSLSEIAKKIEAKRCEKKRKKWRVCFAKTSENEAKQVGFRFISHRSENKKKSEKGTPYAQHCVQYE